jgi:hypothetical protein
VADGGGPAACNGHCRARRLWERAGEVRSWRRGTIGVPWRAHAGRCRAERQRERRGGPGCFSTFFRVPRPGSGQGGCGVDRGELYAYGDELGRTKSASSTVELIFLKFASQVFDEMPERIQISNF